MKFIDTYQLTIPSIPKDKKTAYIDRVIKSLDSKDSNKGLITTIKATHAGRLTGHLHLYIPSAVKAGVDTFTKPFNKPVLVHHESDKDAIGRIVSASYIDTPDPNVPATLIKSVDSAFEGGDLERLIKEVKKLNPFLFDSGFEGLGYNLVKAHILDPNAIEKALDRRYLTVSVGYSTDKLMCSACGHNPFSDECGHSRGKVYKDKGKYPVYWIYGNLTYDELSFVNSPADELAQIIDAEFKDSMYTYLKRTTDANAKFYYFDSNQNEILSLTNFTDQTGEEMKIKDLYNLGAEGFYDKLKEFVAEDQRLSPEALSQLKDEDFAGKNKTFPAQDLTHIQAGEKLLEEFGDSAEKTKLMDFLSVRKSALNAKEMEDKKETAEETQEEKEITLLVKDGKIVSEVDSKILFESLKDESFYRMVKQGDSISWVSSKEATVEEKKSLFEFLLKDMISQKQFEADTKAVYLKELIDSVEKENQKSFIEKFFSDMNLQLVSKDSFDEVSGDLDQMTREYAILKEAKSADEKLILQFSAELKDNIVEEILSRQHREDPEKSFEDSKKELIESNSLVELRAMLKGIKLVSDSVIPKKEAEDRTAKVITESAGPDEGIDQAEYDKRKSRIDKITSKIQRESGLAAAEEFKKTQLSLLDKLLKNNK